MGVSVMYVYKTNRKVAGTWQRRRIDRVVYINNGEEYVHAGSLSATRRRILIPLKMFMEFVDNVHEVATLHDMGNLAWYYDLQYHRLCGHEDSFDMERLVAYGNTMIANGSPLVAAFKKVRQDSLTNDLEVAAFAMAAQAWS